MTYDLMTIYIKIFIALANPWSYSFQLPRCWVPIKSPNSGMWSGLGTKFNELFCFSWKVYIIGHTHIRENTVNLDNVLDFLFYLVYLNITHDDKLLILCSKVLER